MPDNDSEFVSKEDHEKFKEDVIGFLDVLMQAFEKNTEATSVTQASVENLTDAVMSLADLQKMDSDSIHEIRKITGALYDKLIGPPNGVEK